MKPFKTPLLALLCSLLIVAIAGPAQADDSEIFSAASGGTIGPNIMFILDTSGSMSTQVTTRPPYDPTITYPGQAASGRQAAVACDPTLIYFVASGGNIPSCSSTTSAFPASYLKCAAAQSVMASSAGSAGGIYDGDTLIQWKLTASSGKYSWQTTLKNPTNSSGAASGYTDVECLLDYQNGVGPYPNNYTGTVAANELTPTASSSYWAKTTGLTPNYTLYSGNYLNYYNFSPLTVLGTRLSIVQQAATTLINSLNNVNIGLMRYNEDVSSGGGNGNSNSTDADTQGGRVVFPISPIATSRAGLLAALNGYSANGHTPLSETMFEAYRYFSGGAVLYGNTGTTTATKSVAGSRVGNVITSNQYQTPMQYSCQKNFVVYLTDGLPTNDGQATPLIQALPNEAALGGACDASWGTDGQCLGALTQYMFNSDLSPTLAGQQNVQSYFIGFGSDVASGFSYLQAAASRGGGQAFTAGDLSTLQQALTSIVSNILQVSTTFTAPTVAVNAFNRTQTLNDLYVSVFQPSPNFHWPGNVKHYLMSNGVITDANGLPAVDPATGFFKSSAQSIWSSAADGATIPAGGAAQQIPSWDPSATPHRNLYTYVGANPGSPVNLTSSDNYAVSLTNPNLTLTELNVTTAATHDALINYLRGEDLKDENGNGITNESRHAMGDPLHAQPAAVIYGGTTGSPDVTDGVIYAAENDGFLHAISTKDGHELWAFIPQDVLGMIKGVYFNSAYPGKHYMLDGSVRVLKYDVNGDGIVDPAAGDRVIIYFGQGRGGSNYYAIDVTDRNNPKYMWSIGPATLTGIGQAWSNPVIAKVNVGGGTQTSVQKLVLIFAGGYDQTEETQTVVGTYLPSDSVGNSIYMVDAVSGNLLWSAGSTATGSTADLKLARMDHAITADVAVLDTNGDGFADRMYVGDMAGQLWRFDIWNGQPKASLVTGGVIASLGAHDIATPAVADARRFYNTPDISVAQKRGQPEFMNIAIGSGYRGHPLDTTVQDRMYAIRDFNPFTALSQAAYNAITPIQDSNLTDITNVLTPTLSQVANGWKLLLEVAGSPATWKGEKVLSSASTFNNAILFTTYTPGAGNGGAATCQPVLGVNRFYAISVFDGSPVANLNNQNNTTAADRVTTLAQTGIAPSLAFLFPAPTPATDANGNALPTNSQSPVMCMSGVEVLGACHNFQSRIKTYWNEVDAP